MKKSLLISARFLLAVVLLGSSLSHLGTAKILDPAANHPLLRTIANDLDRRGIDVVQNWRSDVPVNSRPVVAPLANYQISLAQKEERWMRDFHRGVTGAITAIRSSRALSRNEFAERWSSTPQSQRVFISFASEDLAYAQDVKASLEARGYVAFIYIDNPGERPSQPPAMVGEYLRTAGTHLVIDTVTARRKSGVLAEALAYTRYRRPPSDGPGSATTRTPRSPDNPGGSGGTVARTRRHYVEIYGASSRCGRTRQAIDLFRKAGAVVKYYDVDANPRAAKVVARNTRWLADGNLLPFIRLNGQPVHATSTGIGSALSTCRIPRQ